MEMPERNQEMLYRIKKNKKNQENQKK